MVGWHHWLNGHEFELAPGVGDEQGSLVCYSPWGGKESDTTEHWTELNYLSATELLYQSIFSTLETILFTSKTYINIVKAYKPAAHLPFTLWLSKKIGIL